MAAALQSRDRLSGLPNEIKLEIFLQLPDAASVYHFSMASKDFRSILDEYYATIVRTLVNHLVSPECAKLAVMANASRRVDTKDDSDIQHFFDCFMNRDDLDDDLLQLQTASEIPSLHHAIIALQNQGLHSWVFRPNPSGDTLIDPATDPMRLIQSYYILEVFSKLCLRVSGSDARAFHFSFGCFSFGQLASEEDSSFILPSGWPSKFWGHFSEEELDLVARLIDVMYYHQRQGKPSRTSPNNPLIFPYVDQPIHAVWKMMRDCETNPFPDDEYNDLTQMPEGTICPTCDIPGTEGKRLSITAGTCSFEAVYHLANFYGHHGKHGYHYEWSVIIYEWLYKLVWKYKRIIANLKSQGEPYVRPGISAASPFLAGLGR